MMKGISLEHDFRLMINNPKYSDIEIICEDKKKLYGSRAILAARSEIFDKLLYNGMKESFEKEISLPEINSFAMNIILEYIYTGKLQEDSLNKDNTIEAFFAADYFNLPELQKFIVENVKENLEKNYTDNYSPELLSRVREKTNGDNILLNSLADSVAVIPLNNLEIGRLSIAGLKYFLEYIHQKEIPFATTEYEIFRYSALLTAKQISYDAFTDLEKRPIIEKDRIAEEFEPLTKYIDFRRIDGKILNDIIDPLEIVPMKTLYNATKYQAKHGNSSLSDIRGISPSLYRFTESDCVWNESFHGSLISLLDGGKVAEASSSELQNVRANILCCKGVYEWDIIIEKYCVFTWIGVCSAESKLDYESFAGSQSNAWILGSSGECRNGQDTFKYCSSFAGNYQTVTVHLDMTQKTIAFTVKGERQSEVLKWNNLPSKLYPIVSICEPGRIRIQPHKNKC
ncbi:10867_t:CDS:2 [Rhizophagus irregularis]|nr:10867_t:CDS:2 [Rhizophagus irregularis]